MRTETAKNELMTVMTTADLLKHWQGHRGLTRRVIEAFPEKELFNYCIGGMRPFGEMVMELLAIAAPGLREIVTGEQEKYDHDLGISSKSELLRQWDETTEIIEQYFPKIRLEQYHQSIKSFGRFESTVIENIFYFIDNEIHHRGQGYVYLRSLDIEPPFFWEH
ncbi:MAG TPA: DinB family protein [Chitinophagaceae bacterium]|nr:DinB family protein [Chitinophagaceae bacterium]